MRCSYIRGMAFALAMALATVSSAMWPDCSVRSGAAGAPAILINNAVHAPLFFCGNNQFGRDDLLLEQLRLAADAGLSLYAFNVRVGDSLETVTETVAKFAAVHPEGYFYLRVWMGPTQEWLEAHPDERIMGPNGEMIPWASPFSTAWRDWATTRLRALLRSVTEGPHGSQFIGLMLSYLETAEWFYPQTDSFWDYSPAAEAAFRGWLRDTYRWNRGLRGAWQDREIRFRDAQIPGPALRDEGYWGPYRHPVRHRPAQDYERFLSEGMVDVIGHFARHAKGVTRGRSLVGVFYGYTFEVNHNGPRALAHSGHLALGKLLDDPNIDLIHAPYSYLERAPGQPGHFHFPIDSIALHGKLALIEDDTYTHLAGEAPPGISAPGYEARPQTLEASLAGMHRNIGNAFAHRAGIWFFDLLSDGRWNDPELWRTMGLIRRMAAELRSTPLFEPEIAVIVSETSPRLLRASSWPLLRESLGNWRTAFARLGAPVGYYLESDLERLPGSVRMLVFLNAYEGGRPVERAAQRMLERGGVVVWTYGAGLYGPDGPDIERVNRLTGMNVVASFRDTPAAIESRSSNETVPLGNEPWELRFVIQPDNITPLARYTDTGEISAAMRKEGSGTVVYTATPGLPASLLSQLATSADIFSYADAPAAVAVAEPYLFVHGLESKRLSLRWPGDSGPVRQLYPLRPGPSARDATVWESVLGHGETQIFRISPPGEADTNPLFSVL